MPQIQVFQCPSCGTNLSYDGGPEITFACQFCGTSVVVPKELRAQAAASVPSPALGDMPSGLPMDKLTELERLALSGKKIEAIKLYRALYGVGLNEAKDAVEKMASSAPVAMPGAPVQPSSAANADGAARLVEVAQLARTGKKIEAIKLYRALYAVELKEAKDAVEAMAAGKPLPGRRAG